MKSRFFGFAILAVLASAHAQNLVQNASFEEGMKHWGSGPYLSGKVIEQDGEKKLLLEGDSSPNMVAAIQHIPGIKPAIYKAEVDIFIENHTSGTFYPIYFQIGTGNGMKYVSRRIEPGMATPGKQHCELMLDLTAYEKISILAAFILTEKNFTGKIYADNFALTPYQPEAPVVSIPKGGGITLNNLLDSETGKATINSSSITLLHDGEKLFFTGRMEAPLLNPVFNRLDSFLPGKSGRETCYRLTQCDSIRISLQSPAGVAHFLAVNAAGGYALERELPENWDGSWNPEGFHAASNRDNGFWTCNVEIPLAALGLGTATGWRINVVRFDSEHGKKSSLARSRDLWKDFSQAPEIILDDKSWTVSLVEITDMMMASRSIPNPAPTWEIINFMKNSPMRIYSGSGNSIAMGPSGIGDAFMLTFMNSSGEVLLRTGKIPDRCDSMMGFFNPSEFNSFKIDGRDVTPNGRFQLSYGINDFSFSAKKDASSNIRIGKMKIPVTGKKLQILREVTTLLPLRPDGIWHLSEEGVYALAWPSGAYVMGKLPSAPLHDFALILDWPETLELTVPKLVNPQAIEVSREDLPAAQGRRKARLRMKSPVTLSGLPASFTEDMKKKLGGCWLIFKALGKAGECGEIIVHAEAENGSVIETPNIIAFDIAEKISAPKLNKLHVKGLFIRIPKFMDEEWNHAMLKNYADAGFTVITNTPTEAGRKMGLLQQSLFYPINLKNHFPAKFLAMHPDFANEFLNPSRYTRTPGLREALTAAWKAWKAERPLWDMVLVDHEYNPFGQQSSCRTPFGIARFVEQYKLATIPEWDEIEKNLRSQWIEFTCSEVGEMVKILSETAVECGLTTMFYSGYQSDYTKANYSIDWNKIGGAFSIYSAGYGFNPTLIEATRSAIGGKNLMPGLLQTGNSAASHSAATMLKYLTAGQAGVLIWYEIYNDAKVFLNVAECVKTIAPYEDFIALGTRADELAECRNELRSSMAVFTLNGKSAAFFFNENVKTLNMTFSCNGTKHAFTLAPGSVKALPLD